MTDEPTGLKQAMAAADRAEAPPALSDPSRLLVAADKLLRFQQARMASERGIYEQRRTERINFYRGEVARLEDEAEAELLAMEQTWQKAQGDILRLIAKLKALRAG